MNLETEFKRLNYIAKLPEEVGYAVSQGLKGVVGVIASLFSHVVQVPNEKYAKQLECFDRVLPTIFKAAIHVVNPKFEFGSRMQSPVLKEMFPGSLPVQVITSLAGIVLGLYAASLSILTLGSNRQLVKFAYYNLHLG